MKKLLLYLFVAILVCNAFIFFELKRINKCNTIEQLEYMVDFYTGIPKYFLKTFSLTEKDKINRAIAKCWDSWKMAGKDTTKCVVDFTEVEPFDWDTLACVYYSKSLMLEESNEADMYAKKYKLENGTDELHFLRQGKIIKKVGLYMPSDDEKGLSFCTRKQLIKCARHDAKFYLQKRGRFFVLRDMSEDNVPTWRYVQ